MTREARIEFRCLTWERQTYLDEARGAGLGLSEWIRLSLREVVDGRDNGRIGNEARQSPDLLHPPYLGLVHENMGQPVCKEAPDLQSGLPLRGPEGDVDENRGRSGLDGVGPPLRMGERPSPAPEHLGPDVEASAPSTPRFGPDLGQVVPVSPPALKVIIEVDKAAWEGVKHQAAHSLPVPEHITTKLVSSASVVSAEGL